jgi:hypothetical protein
MSVTNPSPPRATPPGAGDAGAGPGPTGRLDALLSPLAGRLLLAAGALVAVVVFAVRQTTPNYDSYYALVWGQEIFHGHLPDYAVLRQPTPHPLSTATGVLLAPFGTSGDRILVLLSLLTFVAFLAVAFLFVQRLLGSLVALLAVAVMLTRTDMELLALRAVFDLPFYVLVLGAAVLELGRPRRGWPVLALLGLAGLLRPEAWLLSAAYWAWLVPGTPRPLLVRYALLAAVAPVLWLAADLVVTGEPLYSLTSTREVSGEFGRNLGLVEAVKAIPSYAGGPDRVVTVGVGGLGLLLGAFILRRRAALPLALGALGLATFLIIAAAGLSVIPRYMMIPSLLLTLGVAVALGGWTVVPDRGPRLVAIGIAVVSALVLAWRAPHVVRDFRTLNGQMTFVEAQQNGLFQLLDAPRVVPALQSCRPITVPSHSAIPVIRYETGLPKDAFQATIVQGRPPSRGVHLISATFNFEPRVARTTIGVAHGRTSARRPWSTRHVRGFTLLARNKRWAAYARGC